MAGTLVFFATFASSKNADYSKHGGSLTATSNGSSTISGGKLVFNSGASAYVSFNPLGNFPMTQSYSVRFKLTPGYTGAPAANQHVFCNARTDSDGAWSMFLNHGASPANVSFHNETNSAIKAYSTAWSPTSGTEYEFLLVVDWANAVYRVYINGVLLGTPPTGASVRDALGRILRIGQDHDNNGSHIANFSIRDLAFYEGVLESGNYTPGYTLTVPNSDTWPTEAETKTDVTFYQSNVLKTGTYDGSDRWTSILESKVESGFSYKANSTTNNKTGTLASVTNTMANNDLEAVGPLSAELEEVE